MRLFIPVLLLLSGLLSLLSLQARAASFDCAKATTAMEKNICSSDSLGVMDEVIAKLYVAARKQPGQEAVQQQQRDWLKQRDQLCARGSARECEQVFINRIDQLLQAVRAPQPQSVSVQMLLQGMSVPTLAQLDEYSREKAQALGPDIYTPWARKQITEQSIVSVPVVAAVAGTPYLYFVTYNRERKSSCLYEINLLTGQEVPGRCDVGRRIAVQGDQVLVTQHWSKDNDYFQFKAGTLSQGNIVATAPDEKPGFIANRMREQSVWMASADGQKLAVVARFVFDDDLAGQMPYQQSLQLERMRELADPAALEEARPLVVYDRTTDRISMSPELLPEEDDYYWESIFAVRWNEDSKTVFFDNEGSRLACVWEFDPNRNKLYKIIPEAEAVNPYPFTLDGQDFIVYSVDNHIMLAARPTAR